jgi:hypothetical protein
MLSGWYGSVERSVEILSETAIWYSSRRDRVLRLAEGSFPPRCQQGARLPVPHHLRRGHLGHRALGRRAGGGEDLWRGDHPLWRVPNPASVVRAVCSSLLRSRAEIRKGVIAFRRNSSIRSSGKDQSGRSRQEIQPPVRCQRPGRPGLDGRVSAFEGSQHPVGPQAAEGPIFSYKDAQSGLREPARVNEEGAERTMIHLAQDSAKYRPHRPHRG